MVFLTLWMQGAAMPPIRIPESQFSARPKPRVCGSSRATFPANLLPVSKGSVQFPRPHGPDLVVNYNFELATAGSLLRPVAAVDRPWAAST